jgi:hypothetical protein
MNMNPFRESSPSDLPDRVSKLEKDVKAIQAGYRQNLWDGWRKLGKVAYYAAIAAVVIFVGRLVLVNTLFRGTVWGVEARRNSEREALRWGRVQWPNLTPADVYCTPQGRAGAADDMNCYITDPNRTVWMIVCDDDDPKANDGCDATGVARVVGNTPTGTPGAPGITPIPAHPQR